MLRSYDYKAVIKGDDPVAYYPMDEVSGTSMEDIIRGNNGTHTSSPVVNFASLINYEGAGVDYEASSSQYTTLGTGTLGPLLNGSSAVTVEAWVKLESQSTSNTIISIRQSTTLSGLALYANATGFNIGGRSVSGDTWQSTGNTQTAGTDIYHLVGVIDFPNDDLFLYVNGVLVASNTSATFANTSWTDAGNQTVIDTVGAGSDTVDFFDGVIAHVAVYDRALTQQEIGMHYWVGKKRMFDDYDRFVYEDAPTFYYKLNDTNDTAVDECGNQDGTYIGSIGRRSDPLMPGLDHGGATFDGQLANYINCGDSADFPTGAATFEAIVMSPVRSVDSANHIMAKWAASGTQNCVSIMFHPSNSGKLYTYVSGTGSDSIQTDGGLSTLGHRSVAHYAIVFIPSTSVTIYKNGEQVAQNTTSIPSSLFNSSADFYIGGIEFDGGGTLTGTIQNVAIYSHALPADRIYRHFLAANYTADDYATTVLADDPGAFWRCDDISGTTLTDAKLLNKINGTMAGSPTLDQRGMLVGDTNACLKLEGTDDVVTFGAGNFQYTRYQPFSVEFMLRTTDADSPQPIITTLESVGDGGWEVGIRGGELEFQMSQTGAGVSAWFIQTPSGKLYNDGGEYHVVCTYDGRSSATGADIYVNGVRVATDVNQNNLAGDGTAEPLRIGNRTGSANWLVGWLDEISIYDYEMTPTQVWKHYVLARKAYSYDYYKVITNTANVEAYWPIDEYTGTSIADDTGSGFTGTASGTYTLNAGRIADMPNSKDNSVRFDGDEYDNDVITTPYTGVLQTIDQSNWSVEAWVLPDEQPPGSFNEAPQWSAQYSIITKEGYHTGLMIDIGGRGQFYTYNSSNTGYAATSSSKLPCATDGSQAKIGYHLVGVKDWTNNFVYLYLNGDLVSANVSTGTAKSLAQEFNIGRAATTGFAYPMDGRIAHCSVYSRCLTAEEIKQHYLAGMGRLHRDYL